MVGVTEFYTLEDNHIYSPWAMLQHQEQRRGLEHDGFGLPWFGIVQLVKGYLSYLYTAARPLIEYMYRAPFWQPAIIQ